MLLAGVVFNIFGGGLSCGWSVHWLSLEENKQQKGTNPTIHAAGHIRGGFLWSTMLYVGLIVELNWAKSIMCLDIIKRLHVCKGAIGGLILLISKKGLYKVSSSDQAIIHIRWKVEQKIVLSLIPKNCRKLYYELYLAQLFSHDIYTWSEGVVNLQGKNWS